MNTKENSNYPDNLIEAINGCKTVEWFEQQFDDDGLQQIKFDTTAPRDILGSLEYIICTLSEREQKVLHLRFREGMSLRETGEVFGVTQERIRQVEARAIRKLRHPSRRKYLEIGVMGVLNEEIERAKAHGYAEGHYKGWNDCVDQHYKDEEPHQPAELERNPAPYNITVEDLDLSVRSYNCLKRANIDNAGQIASMDFEDVKRIRNLGRKSTEEIYNKLKELKIETAWYPY